MEIKNAKIMLVQPTQTGVSKAGKDWSKRGFVIESPTDSSKKLFMSAWGELTETIPPTGTFIDVVFDIDSKEYNGRWYTEIRATSITRVNIPIDNGNKEVERDFPYPPLPEDNDFPSTPQPDSDLPF